MANFLVATVDGELFDRLECPLPLVLESFHFLIFLWDNSALISYLGDSVINQLRIPLDFHMLAEGLTFWRGAVDRAHIDLVLVLGIELIPDGLQGLAVAAPGRIVLDKPWLIGNHFAF